MPMKRKSHQDGLDPTRPGVPVTREDLQRGSKAYHQAQVKKQEQVVAPPGSLTNAPPPGAPQHATGGDQFGGGNGRPQPPSPPPAGSQAPEPPIPAGFQAGREMPGKKEEEHPLLAELEENFGLRKLVPKHLELAGYTWTFRPMNFQDYEWMTQRAAVMGTSEPSLSATNVAVTLAAINGTPVYEIFDIPTTGRHIPDPLNPPPDIKYEAAEYMLGWLRNKVGMWELIGELDEKTDILFEEDRKEAYPLWDTLASPYRRRLVELREQLMREGSSEELDGKLGDDASHMQGSSPQTNGQDGSGTTSEQPSSSSTGVTE